ncbi:E1.14.11.1 [Mytilus coruscus]|uniref:E1.14.11.1 n=1 Tax=Mytilus coruscus TaxID=42192 RepID=A0A6J7ZY29_MYTCO|nr:E1.14.11.1 [Mytilus coruscus]
MIPGTLHSNTSYCPIISRNLSSKALSDVATDIRDGGKLLAIDSKETEPLIFPSVWLRFNCHCPSCKQQHSGQRLVDVADIDIDTLVKTTEISENGDVLNLEWSDHKGQIPIKFLKENKLSVSETGNKFSWILDDDMVAEHIAPVQRTVYGLFVLNLLRTFPVRDVPNPINIAYSTAYLPLHNDLHHYESGPGLFFLHCLEFDECVEDGESILLDVNRVAEEFRIQHPEDFKVLTKNAVTIQKVHYERDWPVDMTYKRPHIKLNDKDEIVAVCWAPPFEAPFSGKLEDVETYYKAYHKFAKAVKYSPNIGCYINIDEFKSQVKVLCKLSGDNGPIKPVGNGCWITS